MSAGRKGAKRSLGCDEMNVPREWTTHVSHNRVSCNIRHGILNVLFDESTEPRVLELGTFGIRVGLAVLSERDDLRTKDKTNRQDIHGSGNGRWKQTRG